MFSTKFHFAALDNQVSGLVDHLTKSEFAYIYEDEEFTIQDLDSIIMAAKNLITKYTDIKYQEQGLVTTDYDLPVFAKLLTVTTLGIIFKWLCDHMWIADFCLAAEISQKEVASIERDILKVFDYNICRFMPIRPEGDFIRGTPLVPNPVIPPTPKHLKPIPLPVNPFDEPERDHSVPWNCLCLGCEYELSSTEYSVGTLEPYPDMSLGEFWNSWVKLRAWLETRDIPDYRTKTTGLAYRYRIFVNNPSYWNNLTVASSSMKQRLFEDAKRSGYTPYIMMVQYLITTMPE